MVHPDDPLTPAAETIYNQNQPFWWDAARIVEDDFTFPLYEKAPSEKKQHKGKKKETISHNKTGHYIRAVQADKDYSDVARDATLRTAALEQHTRQSKLSENELKIKVLPEDIRKKVRVRKNATLIVFLVDLSWSMAVTKRLDATKKAITTILNKAYQFRDDICLITFQKNDASVIISPTHSVMLAEKAMKKIPLGGKTPLAAGLTLAYDVLLQESRKYGKENIYLILLSDCNGNIPLEPESDADPQAQAEAAAEQIGKMGYHSIIINSDQMSFGEGHANNLAKHLNAACYLISDLNADHLIKAVRNELSI